MTIEIGTRFKALQDFHSDETKSDYCEGLYYTVQTEGLAGLVKGWLAEGKVELGGVFATMTGKD